jgi:ubiquinone/menaquinone biosynthesis C-methylase UbiE
VAKKYPNAQVVGIDVWGQMWEYSKAKCEQNATAEKVDERVSFQEADAAKLPFEDGFFDAAASNLAFHVVRGVKDKRDVLKEALRVLRNGGRFAFQDGFTTERCYQWEADELISTIRSWGTERVEFEKTMKFKLVPGISIIWGAK